MSRETNYEKVQYVLLTENTVDRAEKALVKIFLKSENAEFKRLLEEQISALRKATPRTKKFRYNLTEPKTKKLYDFCQKMVDEIRNDP